MKEIRERLKETLREYGPAVFKHCRAFTGDVHEAEDLMQEVFARLSDVVLSGKRDRDVIPWKLVQGVMRNVFYEHLRQKKRHREVLATRAATADEETAGDQADLAEQRQIVRQLLSKLGVVEQEAILGRHFLGLTLAELTRMLGLPRSTVVDHYNRGMIKLQELAREHGVLP